MHRVADAGSDARGPADEGSDVRRPDPLAGEDLPPAPRQERSRRTQEAVLAAALTLFAERGYDNTGMADIAERSGVAVGAVYRHYRTKRQLLLVLVDRMLAEIAALDLRPPPGVDPRAAVASLLGTAMATDAKYVGAYRAWAGLCARDRRLAEVDAEIVDWSAGRLADVLVVARDAPGGRADLDVPATARLLTLLFWRLLLEPEFDADRTHHAVAAMLGHLLFTDPAVAGQDPPG